MSTLSKSSSSPTDHLEPEQADQRWLHLAPGKRALLLLLQPLLRITLALEARHNVPTRGGAGCPIKGADDAQSDVVCGRNRGRA